MRNSNSDLHTLVRNAEAELDQVERQAMTVLGTTLMLAVAIYSIWINPIL